MPKNSVVIHPFTRKDIADAVNLEKSCFSNPWSKKAFEEALDNRNSCFFAAEQNGKFVGFAGLYSVFGEGYIYNIAVCDNCRGKGIGTALMQKLLDYSKEKGLEFLSLEVRYSNASAIKLYEKCGFKHTGIRKNFYDKPSEDGIIMTKLINNN